MSLSTSPVIRAKSLLSCASMLLVLVFVGNLYAVVSATAIYSSFGLLHSDNFDDVAAAAPLPNGDRCRDRFLEPFSSESIWNTAIGSKARFFPATSDSDPDTPTSKARFSPANLYTIGREPSQFHNDQVVSFLSHV